MTPDRETARSIAKEHCAAWTGQAPDLVASRYAENATMIMNGGDPLTGRLDIGGMAAGFMADFPDLVLTLDSVLVADHHRSMRGHLTAITKKPEIRCAFRGGKNGIWTTI